jgi:hypothetical protein
MRCNMFVQKDGRAYGALVCSVCNKNVTLELEHRSQISRYGDGSRVLSMLGSPRPPNVVWRRVDGDASLDDQTL